MRAKHLLGFDTFSFQAAEEGAVACLRRGQGWREEDTEEVAAECVPIEGSRADGWAETIQAEERETRLATGGDSRFPRQGCEDRENLLPPDDRGGLVEAAGFVDGAQAAATTAAEARAAPEVPRCRRGGVHLRRSEDERRETDENASVSSRRLLREHNVGRRLVGLGQAEGREEEAEEKETAAAATAAEEIDDKQRNGAEQARLQRENLARQYLRIIFLSKSWGVLLSLAFDEIFNIQFEENLLLKRKCIFFELETEN